MFLRQIILTALAALGLAQYTFALDLPSFREAAMAYQTRMMQNVETVVIEGTTTTWFHGAPVDVNFTEMYKHGMWRKESRSLWQRTPYDYGKIHVGALDALDLYADATPSAKPQPAPPDPPKDKSAPQPAQPATPSTPSTQPAPQAQPAPQPAQPATPTVQPAPPSAQPAPPARPNPPARRENPAPPVQPSTPVPVTSQQSSPPVQPLPVIRPTEVQPATPPPSPAGERRHRGVRKNNRTANTPGSLPTSPPAASAPVPINDSPAREPDSLISVTIFNGLTVWEMSNGKVTGSYDPEAEDFDPPVIPGHGYWSDLQDSLAVVSSDKYRTRDCWVVETDSARLWVDKNDFFLVAQKDKDRPDRVSQSIECSAFFGFDNGYIIPGRIDHFSNNQLVESKHITNVYFNRQLDDGLFQVNTLQQSGAESKAGQTPRVGKRRH